jgi:hypothetical protein
MSSAGVRVSRQEPVPVPVMLPPKVSLVHDDGRRAGGSVKVWAQLTATPPARSKLTKINFPATGNAAAVGDELRRQPCPGGGPLEVFLVAAADDQLVPAALEQVPLGGGALLGDVLVDRLTREPANGGMWIVTVPASLAGHRAHGGGTVLSRTSRAESVLTPRLPAGR